MKTKLVTALTTATLALTLLGGAVSADHLSGLTKADCKNGGFAEYQRVNGDERTTFRNQGECIKFVNTGR